MVDSFENTVDTLSAPAARCFEIIPMDGANLPRATKAIFVGTGGDIVLRAVRDETEIVFRNVPGGTILPVRVAAVSATGTSASDIVGFG